MWKYFKNPNWSVPRHAPCSRECSLEAMPALCWGGRGTWGLPYPLAPSWMIILFLEKEWEVNWLELPSDWPFYFAGLFYVIIHSSHPFLVSNIDLVVLSETDASYWIKDPVWSKNSQLRVPTLASHIGQRSVGIQSGGEKQHCNLKEEGLIKRFFKSY